MCLIIASKQRILKKELFTCREHYSDSNNHYYGSIKTHLMTSWDFLEEKPIKQRLHTVWSLLGTGIRSFTGTAPNKSTHFPLAEIAWCCSTPFSIIYRDGEAGGISSPESTAATAATSLSTNSSSLRMKSWKICILMNAVGGGSSVVRATKETVTFLVFYRIRLKFSPRAGKGKYRRQFSQNFSHVFSLQFAKTVLPSKIYQRCLPLPLNWPGTSFQKTLFMPLWNDFN